MILWRPSEHRLGHARPLHGIRGSLVAVKMTFTTDEANELMNGSRMCAPTSDDVCVTHDGRRLDTPEKLIAWVQEFNADRTGESER